jgi:predicted small secreted protein
MKNWTKILLSVSIAVMLLSACGVVKGFSDVSKAGDAFMAALRDGKNDVSYAMLTTALQQEIGGKDAWAQFTAPRNFESWNFTSTNIQNDQGQLDGQGKLGGDTYDITLVFQNSSSGWLVAGIQFSLAK